MPADHAGCAGRLSTQRRSATSHLPYLPDAVQGKVCEQTCGASPRHLDHGVDAAPDGGLLQTPESDIAHVLCQGAGFAGRTARMYEAGKGTDQQERLSPAADANHTLRVESQAAQNAIA
jgi:hypothetical protein